MQLGPGVLGQLTGRLQALYDSEEFQCGAVAPFVGERKLVKGGGDGFATDGVFVSGQHSLRVKRMQIPVSEFFWFPQFVQAAHAVGLEVTVGEVKVYTGRLAHVVEDDERQVVGGEEFGFAEFYGVGL
eukprot:2283075-Rhodomonas_salina.2